MNENWVLDASPIILLGKADLLKIVSPLAKVWIIPSLGLILLAKRKGLLNLAKPEIERLEAVGLYIDSSILTRILTRIGEGDKGG